LLEFRILGPFEAVEEDRPVALGGPRQRALLAILVLSRGEVVSTDRLVDQIWGEQPPATATKTLQVYVSHLRKALGAGVLVTRNGGYVLAAQPDQVDAERFDALVADGRTALADGDHGRARDLLGSALGLWRGDPLADLAYETFAPAEVNRLKEGRLAALEERIEADLALARQRALVGELEALVAQYPYQERLRGQLMLALYRSGRQSHALEVYRSGRSALREELGLEPGPDLRALEQRILIQDESLDLPKRATRSGSVAPQRRAISGRTLVMAGAALLAVAAIAAATQELTRGGATASVHVLPNSLAAISTGSNHVVAQVPVGTRPGALTYGSGSLWVANLDDQTVSRVDPKTLRTLRALPVADPPTGIAAADGTVWVAESSPGTTSVWVSRVDPRFDSITRTARIGNVVPGSAVAAVGRGRSLWVAPYAGELTRVNARSGRVARQVDPGAGAAGLAVGAGGAWLTDSDANNVTRVDATGLVTSLAVGHGPSGIAIGGGAVWVADTGDNAVVRIDPTTRSVTTTIPVGESPTGVAFGAGSVWVANSGDGTVTRIDPASGRAVATIAIGGSPRAITVVGNRAWVTLDAPTITPSRLAARGGTARLLDPSDTGPMDPAQAYDPAAWQLLYAVCAKLLNYPDKAGLAGARLVPEVAQSLPAPANGGKSYTFTIRRGFRFSPPSNEPVTAQTFKDTIERTLNPRMRNQVANEFADIVGARAYIAGKAAHIAGVTAHGNKLTVRLRAPAPDLLARLAQPFFCAVPSGTPIDPKGLRTVPSAGPYQVASYTPGQGVVLTRNPNYRGSRPHRLARIEAAVGIPGDRAVRQVAAGTSDYALDGEVTTADAATLSTRYGRNSAPGRSGRQQYFVSPEPAIDFLALNTHRPLFADVRLRRAVNYAIDRAALARLGSGGVTLPDNRLDHYLPAGVPGYRKLHVYPSTPDLAKARRLARGHEGATVVLYTCSTSPCVQQAQVIRSGLSAIGLRLDVKAFPAATLYAKMIKPSEPFDIGYVNWLSDYPDPAAILNLLLESGTVIPTFNDPAYRARLAAAATLTGAKRYLEYGRLDADLARNAAPWVAWGNTSSHDFFSARMGCQVYGVYGMDLAALCIKKQNRR
jgi:YVTN family beta-propeller protein